MAICKRPAAAVVMGMGAGQANKKRRVAAVAKRTWPSPSTGTIKKPAYASTADYELETPCLGEGAFGVVYKARHRATGQTVAIKFLASPPPEVSSAGPDPRELLREARFLEQAACSNVVGFRCVVRNPYTGELGLVMDFVDGQSLRDILEERRDSGGNAPPPIPEATVRACVRQILTAAKGMHERGMVHRDIKPANVLVADDGEEEEVLKVCDFGLAISTASDGDDPPPHGEAGTMLHAAPEVLAGKPDHDAPMDAWSVGCVMAELVGGGEILLLRAGVEDALLEMRRRPCGEEVAYLCTIFGLLGAPDNVNWPGFASLPRAAKMPPLKQLGQRSRLREMFPEETLSEEGFEVMNGLFTCDPQKRLTAADALKLPWFAGDED